jgi:hypothetical protein
MLFRKTEEIDVPAMQDILDRDQIINCLISIMKFAAAGQYNKIEEIRKLLPKMVQDEHGPFGGECGSDLNGSMCECNGFTKAISE